MTTTPTNPQEPILDGERMELLPCPHCGSVAKFGRVDDDESDDFGGEFIQCTNIACAASTMLIFPTMADAQPLLIEKWNRRAALSQGKQQAEGARPSRCIVGSKCDNCWCRDTPDESRNSAGSPVERATRSTAQKGPPIDKEGEE